MLRHEESPLGRLDTEIVALRLRRGAGEEGTDRALAAALIDKAHTLRDIGRLDEILAPLAEAIGIRRTLVAAGLEGVENDLAEALGSRGNALLDLGRFSEALGQHNEAIRIRRSLISAGCEEIASALATSLRNKGMALRGLGQFTEAGGLFDEAIGMHSALLEAGHKQIGNELAASLMEKARTLRACGHFLEAVDLLDKAIATRRSLIKEGREEIALFLAPALLEKGLALQDLGRLRDAADQYDEAIGIHLTLIAAGREGHRNYLATALTLKGQVLQALGRISEAVASYDEAVGMRRFLVDEGHHWIEDGLAIALLNRAIGLLLQSDRARACADLREAISLWGFVIDRDGLFIEERGLAMTYGLLAEALLDDDDFGRAEDALFEGLDVIPHRPEILEAGYRFFERLMRLPDTALERGGFSREEARDGFAELLFRVLPFQGDSRAALVARARHEAFVLHDGRRGMETLEGAVRDRGRSDPLLYVELVRLTEAVAPTEDVWTRSKQALEAVSALLHEFDGESSNRTLTELQVLLDAALELGITATRRGLSEAVSPAERSERAYVLREALGPLQERWPLCTPGQRDDFAQLQKALSDQHGRALAQLQEQMSARERVLDVLFGQRWQELAPRFAAISERTRRGTSGDDDAAREIEALALSLGETREVRVRTSQVRRDLNGLLGFDPVVRTPELRKLVTGLALEAAATGADGMADVILVMLGSSVEAGLWTRLFGPYLAAVSQEGATAIEVDGTLGAVFARNPDRPLMLGDMEKWFGKMVTHWRDSKESRGLAEWVEATFRAPTILRNRALGKILGEARHLRNKGAHPDDRGATSADVENMKMLLLKGGTPFIRSFYRALFGDVVADTMTSATIAPVREVSP